MSDDRREELKERLKNYSIQSSYVIHETQLLQHNDANPLGELVMCGDAFRVCFIFCKKNASYNRQKTSNVRIMAIL